MKPVVSSPAQVCLHLISFIVALGLAACAGSDRDSGSGLRGYGTPGVSAYVPANEATSVQAQRERCARVPLANPADTVGLPAACAQLRHILRNQPGNAVPSPAL